MSRRQWRLNLGEGDKATEGTQEQNNEKKIGSIYGGDATAPLVAQTFRYARTIKGPAWFFIGYRTE